MTFQERIETLKKKGFVTEQLADELVQANEAGEIGAGGGVSQNYSTSEIALLNSDGTPLLWIDNKPIYQLTVSGNVTGSQFLSFGLSNIDTLINAFGVAKNTSINAPDSNLTFVGINKTSVQIQATASPLGLYSITVQYTKI